MSGISTGVTTRWRDGVAYTLLRPMGVRLFYLSAAAFILSGAAWGVLTFLGFDGPARGVCGVMAVVSFIPAAIWFAAHGGQMGLMVRAFYPYQGVTGGLPHGTPLRGGARYRADDHVGAVMFAQGVPRWGLSQAVVRRAWHALCEPGVPRFRSVAEQELEGALEGITLTRDLLEPESIVPSRRVETAQVIAAAIMVGVALAVVYWLGRREHAVLLIAAMLFGVVPLARGWFRVAFMESTAPVAGCGVVRVSSRRWTVADAIMIVESRVGARPLVTLLGSAGAFTLSFQRIDDPDFVALWQRWNHPDPKPDLLP